MAETNLDGMLTLDELRSRVDTGQIDTVAVTFTDVYGRQMGKRMDARYFLEAPDTHACDYLLTVDMNMDPVPGYALASWERGYGDFHMVPDFATLRVASSLRPRMAYSVAFEKIISVGSVFRGQCNLFVL